MQSDIECLVDAIRRGTGEHKHYQSGVMWFDRIADAIEKVAMSVDRLATAVDSTRLSNFERGRGSNH